MDSYIQPILWGILVFPFIAALFTFPYVFFHYRKYGSVPMFRVLIVYSFILYLICAYFLVILPLPSPEEVAKLTGPEMQLVPFQFVTDFITNTSLVVSDPSTYLKVLGEPWFYQVVYNVLLFVPFGVYLRYYFKCGFLKTVVLSLLLSLFFELTQLTGLYGYYERAYRLFDVDDLMINTFGGLIGFAVGGLAIKFLPNRDELDKYAYKKGEKITVWRKIMCFMFDVIFFSIFSGIIYGFMPSGLNERYLVMMISFIFYFVLIPFLFKGQTLGKKLLKIKVVDKENNKPKFYQYFIRYAVLFLIYIPFPFYLIYGLLLVGNVIDSSLITPIIYTIGLIVLFIFGFIYYLVIFIKMCQGKELWYEKISGTKNVSTIKNPNKTVEKNNEELKCEDLENDAFKLDKKVEKKDKGCKETHKNE